MPDSKIHNWSIFKTVTYSSSERGRNAPLYIIDQSDVLSQRIGSIYEGQIIRHVFDGRQLVNRLIEARPKVVLVGAALAADDSCRLCRLIRSEPALLLTLVLALLGEDWTSRQRAAVTAEAHGVEQLPRTPEDILAAIRAMAQRVDPTRHNDDTTNAIAVGEISVVSESYAASVGARTVAMTASEFRLLWALAQNAGRVMTMNELSRIGDLSRELPSDRAIRARVASLRHKLGTAAGQIENVRGVGYRLKP